MASFDASVAAQDSRIVCSVWVATIIFLVYDWSLTLAKESYHIWTRAQWTIRFLYASCRYGSMASLLVACVCALGRIEVHQEMCIFCYYWIAYTSTFNYGLVATVLILRINALYSCNRKLLLALLTMLFALVVFAVIFLTVLNEAGVVSSSDRSKCLDIRYHSWSWLFWVPKISFESLLITLALGRTVTTRYHLQSQPARLERLLLRDSIFACIGTLTFAIVNVVVWRMRTHYLVFAFAPAAQAVESVIGSRLILNIREFGDPVDGQRGRRGGVLQIQSPNDIDQVYLSRTDERSV